GQRVYRGADLRFGLGLTLEQAVAGDTVTINVPTLGTCEVCHGSGAKAGSHPETCPTCAGRGQVRMQQGFFTVQQTCPRCRGKGTIISDPCDRIRLSGEGEAGPNGGPSGDLYVEITVEPHEIFSRDGADLACEVPVSFVTAALGGEIEVPTLGGSVSLKIPSETQTGKVFRLRGKGVKPVRGGSTGDLLCRVEIETPVHLSKEQKELLKKFDTSVKEDGDRHSPRQHSWLKGVKKFFE